MLGLSYTQFYHSHRGVLLLSLSTAFPTPSPVPSPSSRLCVPQLPALNPIPIPQSPQPGPYPCPFYPTPTPPFFTLPFPSFPNLCPFLSFLFAAVPLFHSLPLSLSPLIILLNYLLSILPLSPALSPFPYLLSLHPIPISTHNNSRSVPHCRLSFSPIPDFFLPPISLPLPPYTPLTFS